jgi:hypothetical protein
MRTFCSAMLLRGVEALRYDYMVNQVSCIVPLICHQPLASAACTLLTSHSSSTFDNPHFIPAHCIALQVPEPMRKQERASAKDCFESSFSGPVSATIIDNSRSQTTFTHHAFMHTFQHVIVGSLIASAAAGSSVLAITAAFYPLLQCYSIALCGAADCHRARSIIR